MFVWLPHPDHQRHRRSLVASARGPHDRVQSVHQGWKTLKKRASGKSNDGMRSKRGVERSAERRRCSLTWLGKKPPLFLCTAAGGPVLRQQHGGDPGGPLGLFRDARGHLGQQGPRVQPPVQPVGSHEPDQRAPPAPRGRGAAGRRAVAPGQSNCPKYVSPYSSAPARPSDTHTHAHSSRAPRRSLRPQTSSSCRPSRTTCTTSSARCSCGWCTAASPTALRGRPRSSALSRL